MLHEFDKYLFDRLEVGISILTWRPKDWGLKEWIFVNKARCKMVGFTREELLAKPPLARTTRESRSQAEIINAEVTKNGCFITESTLLHKSNKAIPVILHLYLVKFEGTEALMVEIHDISSFKETEAKLELSQESTRGMLALIEKEKQDLTQNIKRNLGLVLHPLMDQLRMSATDQQQEVLDLMVKRIGHLEREMGIVNRLEAAGLNLTRRQILICEMIRDGMTSKEIALALNCAPSTINNHRNSIRKKLKLTGKWANLQAFLNSSQGSGEQYGGGEQ
jgi:PAS domain S-box-containing protein